MDLEYLLVGVSRDQEEDYRQLYDITRCEVFAVALSLLKDRFLAREVMIETYRRVRTFAYTFDTDWNAEYWILEIVQNLSANALQDKELQEAASAKRLDNASKLLRQTVLDTKNDRGSILLLHALTKLRNADIAKLLWYRAISAQQEYRRGIKQLIAWDKERTEQTILEDLRRDVDACTPDVWEWILREDATKVAHISHEQLSLTPESLEYSPEDPDKLKQKQRQAKQARFRKLRIAALCVGGTAAAALLVWVLVLVLHQGDIGREETGVQFQTKLAMVEVGDVLYYQNPADQNKLYAFDFSAQAPSSRKLCDDPIKELLSDGAMLYYRNNKDGKMYRIALDGSGRMRLSDRSGAAMALYDQWLYFSGTNGIYRMKKDGTDVEEVLNTEDDATLYRYQIAVENGVVYFSSGIGKGIHYVKEYEGIPLAYNVSKGFYDEVYAFQIENGYLYFDFLLNNHLALYRIDLSSGEREQLDTLPPISGANYTIGNHTYYYGCEETEEGVRSNYGIYVYDAQAGTNQLIRLEGSANYAGTELLIGKQYIYCYFSDGKENGKRQLVAYDRDNPSEKTIIQA